MSIRSTEYKSGFCKGTMEFLIEVIHFRECADCWGRSRGLSCWVAGTVVAKSELIRTERRIIENILMARSNTTIFNFFIMTNSMIGGASGISFS